MKRQRMRSGRVPSMGDSVPRELGCTTFPALEALQTVLVEFLQSLYYVGSWIINSISSPSPLPRHWAQDQRSQASNHGLVLLVLSLHPEVIRQSDESHLTRRKSNLSLRKFQGLGGSVSGTGGRDQQIIFSHLTTAKSTSMITN